MIDTPSALLVRAELAGGGGRLRHVLVWYTIICYTTLFAMLSTVSGYVRWEDTSGNIYEETNFSLFFFFFFTLFRGETEVNYRRENEKANFYPKWLHSSIK